MDSYQIGQRLKIFRKEKNKTQAYMADVVGVNHNTFGKYERGELGLDLGKLQKLHTILNLNLNWLISGIGESTLETYSTSNITKTDKIKESTICYENNNSIEFIKNKLVYITSERDLYKKLCEKTEIEVEFYKAQLNKDL